MRKRERERERETERIGDVPNSATLALPKYEILQRKRGKNILQEVLMKYMCVKFIKKIFNEIFLKSLGIPVIIPGSHFSLSLSLSLSP